MSLYSGFDGIQGETNKSGYDRGGIRENGGSPVLQVDRECYDGVLGSDVGASDSRNREI